MSNQATGLALVQQATVKHKVKTPKHSGIDNVSAMDIAWTGGNPYDNTITGPAKNSCYQPIELDKARTVEDKCVQPLPEARRLKPLTAKARQKQVPLIQWMVDVEMHLVMNGMDGVFYHLRNGTVICLLEQWSKVTITKVTEFICNEAWDHYGYNNLQLSGKFI